MPLQKNCYENNHTSSSEVFRKNSVVAFIILSFQEISKKSSKILTSLRKLLKQSFTYFNHKCIMSFWHRLLITGTTLKGNSFSELLFYQVLYYFVILLFFKMPHTISNIVGVILF